MPLAKTLEKNLSRREQTKRLRKIAARLKKRGLQPWVKNKKGANVR